MKLEFRTMQFTSVVVRSTVKPGFDQVIGFDIGRGDEDCAVTAYWDEEENRMVIDEAVFGAEARARYNALSALLSTYPNGQHSVSPSELDADSAG